MSRPALPERHANQRLKLLDAASLPPVKYQILNCQGQDILVGRMKIATPTASGHAFILRRFDTGAISLTTMFRAAFPEASDNEEKRETTWVKDNYDLSGNNGSSREHSIVRLAGTWVSPDVALALADSYHLGSVIPMIAEASPDPNVTYRRSGKGAGESPMTPAGSRNLITTSPATAPSAAKRRKESSPQVEPETSVPTRRSTRPRSKSPSASSVLSPARKPNRTTKAAKASTTTVRRAAAPVTPGGSDETAVDEDAETAEGLGDDMFKEDVAEQRHLIANLKSRREAAKEGAGEKVKRAREDQEYPTQLNLKEPEIGERTIATNRRVGRFHLEPRQRSFAWGVAAFAFGLGAVTFLPNLM